MFTTALWFLLLFVSRVFADLLVSDVYSSQSQCDTSVDLFKNKNGETPCTVVLELLTPCNVNVSESSTAEIGASACACNVAFYNLLSACALFCVKKSVDPFYKWTNSCIQVVPMTRGYPFIAVITTTIPTWASKDLSSGGNFDPSAVMRGGWTTLQKITPVIVGLVILILVGLLWWWHRTYKWRRSSRRAQGACSRTNHSLGHHRDGSAASQSSTSRLNATNPSQLSLPVHRIRYFFSGMLPVRERRRGSDWNIEGEPGLPRRSSIVDDPPSRRESDSFFTPAPSVHAPNDTPPTSPVTPWSPIQTISRWWTSVSPSKGKDYQSVHLLSTRKNSKFGNDDDNHPELEFMSSPPRNNASGVRNDHTSGEEIPSVVVSNGERQSVSRPQTPQPEAEPPSTHRLPSLRPNRPGYIVAIEDPSPSQPSPSGHAPTSPDLLAFPSPPGIRPQISSDTFHTSYTTLSADQESERTMKPKKKLSPELLFPPSVRAAGYSVPQQPNDPVVRAWIPRVNGTSNGHSRNPATEPPSYQQAHGSTATLPRPLSPTSTHPYPYTNHLRSTSDVTVLDISRSPRPHLQNLNTTDTQNESVLNRLSMAVNEPTSAVAAASENGSGDGYMDFTPISIVHESDVLKNPEYTPYPSSAMLPLSATGASRGGHPPPDRS